MTEPIEETPGPLVKSFDPAEVNLTPGECSDVSWITTDVVDADGEVVVSKGIDFTSRFMGKNGNPVVMACHDYQKWPVGTCAWIKAASTPKFNGLTAKTMYDEDPDAQRLFGLVQRRVVRGRSIGFIPPADYQPGDWGPPTPAELKARPDWKDARRIIRRCVLIEYSVCPIPVNPASLTVVVSKAASMSLELPSYMKGLADELGIVPGEPAPAPKPAAKAEEWPPKINFTLPADCRTLAQIQADLSGRLAKSFDPARLADAAAKAAIDRARGVI